MSYPGTFKTLIITLDDCVAYKDINNFIHDLGDYLELRNIKMQPYLTNRNTILKIRCDEKLDSVVDWEALSEDIFALFKGVYSLKSVSF